VAYRVNSYDVPLWVHPNRRSGRWNLAGVDATQYFALEPAAPFAEMLRHEDLRTEDAAATFSTSLWQARIDESSVVDYGSFEKAEDAGFPADALVDDDHERCQAEAVWLKAHGATGLLSPSAALPGAVNVTVFGARVAIPWTAPRRLASQMPVQKLSTGAPPVGLVARTRFFNTEHAGLAAYQASRRT
jgi:RES domain-containing protein